MSTLYMVFDTETTDIVGNDLKPLERQPFIIEFAAVLATVDAEGNGELLREFTCLINPGFPVSKDTTRMTNITNEMLVGKPSWNGVAKEIQGLLDEAGAFVGQNVMFDVKMTQIEMRRINSLWLWPNKPKFCTIELSEHIFGRRVNLGDMHQKFFGVPHASAHRAMADVKATLACFRHLMKIGAA